LETIASETKDVAWSVYTVITARLSFTPRRLVASRKDCLALSVEKTAHVEVRYAPVLPVLVAKRPWPRS